MADETEWEPLIEVSDLRLDWELDAKEQGVAEEAIESLSDDARYYGSETWINGDRAPRQVKSIIRRAAQRYVRNPDGYITSRAGDETLGWTDRGEDAGSASFTKKEIEMLRTLGGNVRSGFYQPEVVGYGSRDRAMGRRTGWVPTGPNSKPFPLYASEDGPW